MRKYDYDKMTRALTFTEEGETRAMLVLLEMDWSYAQVLQFLRERDKWNQVRVLRVDPTPPKAEEPELKLLVEVTDAEGETVDDQITDAVTENKPSVKQTSAQKKKT